MFDWVGVADNRGRAGQVCRRDEGFTRIKPLVVIVMLGILAAAVVFLLQDTGDMDNGASVAIDEQTMRTAEEAYFEDFGRYGTQEQLVAAGLLESASSDSSVVLKDCPDRPACEYSIGGRLESVQLAGLASSGYPSPFRASPGTGGIQNVSYMFDSLTWLDAEGNVIPALATSWETNVGGDPTKTRFTLREGVTWADGRPFTADDVVFTWDYQRPDQPGYLGTNTAAAFSQEGVTNVVALSPTLVEFTTSSADATLLYQTATRNFIVPRHIWQDVDAPQTWDDPGAQIGTGPYTLASYNLEQGTFAFDAKDSYFMGTPYVQRIEFVAAGTDPLLALQNGVIDLADIGSQPYTMSQLDSLDPARYGRITTGGISTHVLMYNMETYPYNDKRFRQALAWAIDRPDMASRLLPLGGGPTNMGMVQPNEASWNPPDVLGTVKYVTQPPNRDADLTMANTLLDQVGLTVGAGGMRYIGSTQFRPTIQICETEAFTAVQSYLLAVGIDAEAESVTCDFGPASQMNNNATSGNYEMILRTFGPTSDPDGLRSFLSDPAPPGTWWHAWGWGNASPEKQDEFETLLTQQRSLLDPEARQAKSFELQRLVADELPELYLVGANRIAVFDKRVVTTWNYPGPLRPGGPATMSTAAYNKLHFINLPPA